MSTTTAGIVLFTAAVIAALGVMIRYYGMVELIAGYDSAAVSDDSALAEFVGRNMLYIAALSLITAVAEYARLFDRRGIIWTGYGIVVTGLAIWTAVGAQRYTD